MKSSRLIDKFKKTERRYKNRQPHRAAIEKIKKETPDAQFIDTQQTMRRLEYKGYDDVQILFTDKITRERTIGENDLLKINYLSKGTLASKSVGRITINSSRGSGHATGFLIGNNLLMTNNHVFPFKTDTRNSYVEFNYEEDVAFRPTIPEAFSFDADRFFITSKDLDFTIVSVENRSMSGNATLPDFGNLKLIERIGKLQRGEKVSIIQHPKGERKQVALRNNEVVDIFDDFLHYETDTEPGSSGSPVFNEQWEVVGVHSSGVPERDTNGNIITINGMVWSPNENPELISWVANEGVRTSSIIKFLRNNANSEQLKLLGQTLEVEDAVVRPIIGPNISTDSEYYDAKVDKKQIERYYDVLNFDADSDELTEELSILLEVSHQNRLPYRPSKYVYPEVDLHENGKLKSIYSGKEFSVQEFIMMDNEVDLKRQKKLLEFNSANELVRLEEFSQELDAIESSLPYNCEHVVPQSWYDKRSPMKGDLHHLFACESRCNSFRSNFAYYDFVDYTPDMLQEVVREECGKREGRKFEPEFNKGAVARATLYYFLRYPNMLEGNYTKDAVETLLAWHMANEISRYEQHRNYKIFQMQGNRNPFIDHPELAKKVDFSKLL